MPQHREIKSEKKQQLHRQTETEKKETEGERDTAEVKDTNENRRHALDRLDSGEDDCCPGKSS